MRLLFISQYIYRPDQPASNRIYDCLQEMARRGHEPIAIAGGVHYLDDRISPELQKQKIIATEWDGVKVRLAYATPDFRGGVIPRLRSYFSFAWYGFRAALGVGRVDAVLVSVQPMFIAPLAWLVSRWRKVPFLLEVRDLWPDAAIETGLIRSRFLIRLGRWLEMFVYRRAEHIITIGPEMKRVIAGKGIPQDKIDVMPQGYRPPDSEPRRREQTRTELGLDEGAFVLVFAGSFGLANNDVRSIIEAAARLKDEPDLVFLMIGQGNLKQECVDRCEREGIDNVRFIPMVPKEEIHSYLAAADAGLMTLPPGEFWKICLQNKIFDYMGGGLPVIAAVDGDQKTLIEDADGGVVVPPGDVAALAEAIVTLKRDPQRARRCGANARRYIRENLLRTDVVSSYVDLVERWVGESGDLAR